MVSWDTRLSMSSYLAMGLVSLLEAVEGERGSLGSSSAEAESDILSYICVGLGRTAVSNWVKSCNDTDELNGSASPDLSRFIVSISMFPTVPSHSTR
jgi:hypothetical protein